MPCHVGGNVQGERSFTHTGAGSDQQQIRLVQTGSHRIQIGKSCSGTYIFFFVRPCNFAHMVIGFTNGIADLGQPLHVLALPNVINPLFCRVHEHLGTALAGLNVLQDAPCRICQTTDIIFFRDNGTVALDIRGRRHTVD